MVEILLCLFVLAVGYGFGLRRLGSKLSSSKGKKEAYGVDWAATTDADEGVDCGLFGYSIGRFV